jgi:hypothetical protein
MRLVPNWRQCWKWFSVQIAIVGAALQAAVLAFPDLKDWLGDTVTHLAGLVMLFGLVAARLVDQKKPDA